MLTVSSLALSAQNPRLLNIIRGLGREPFELTPTYWQIMRRYKYLLTAEEEEQRRFADAPSVEVPDTPFSRSVYRLLRACMRAHPGMAGISITFVRAEHLRLQLFYVKAERLFRIHERWVSQEGAAKELGLSDHTASDDLILHTVRDLFDEALRQLPQKAPAEGENDTGTPNRTVSTAAHQRVLDYQHMGDFTIHRLSETSPGLSLRWSKHSRKNDGLDIEVQCHRAKCPHVQDVLIAKDGTYMFC